jgi:hypothetical protein
VIFFYDLILRPAQEEEFWIPSGREPQNIFHGGSFQLSKFLVKFDRGRWMIFSILAVISFYGLIVRPARKDMLAYVKQVVEQRWSRVE